jgi:aspartate/methionine/tyrosine aminotransferase
VSRPTSSLSESRRTLSIQRPIIPIVRDWIEATPGTISLGQGVVSYGPPPEALAALLAFPAEPANHKYGPVEGIAPLREALARKLTQENDTVVGPERRVVVTAGGNMAFLAAILAIADPGDEVVLLRPFYFNHEMAVRIAGAEPVCVDTDESFQPRIDAIRAALGERTRAVVTISPNNPTGAVYPEDTLSEINALCRARRIYHIHDEAYEYFTYAGARHFSPASIPDSQGHTIALYSFSKAYGFASWRVGYMVLPEHLGEAVRKIQDTNLICPPVVSQHAALGALEAGAGYCRERLTALGEARAHWLDALSRVPHLVDVAEARGAFYLMLRVRTALDSMTLGERLVREHRVAVVPGAAFGVVKPTLVRASYGALTPADAAEGLRRFVSGLTALCGGS